MAIDPANANPPTNPLRFQDIIDEFGENNTNSLGGYRMENLNIGGLSEIPLDADTCGINANSSIPVDNQEIKFSDFYNSKLNVLVDCYTSNENRVDAKSKYTALASAGNYRIIGPKGGDNSNTTETPPSNTSGKKITILVTKEIGSVKSNTKSRVALNTGTWTTGTDLTINVRSTGFISGAGGDGAAGSQGNTVGLNGGNGNSAIGVEYTGGTTKIKTATGAKIRRGFGGGGSGGSGWGDNEEGSKPQLFGQGSGGGGGAGIPAGLGGEESDFSNFGIYVREAFLIHNGNDGFDGSSTSGGAGGALPNPAVAGYENGVPTIWRGGAGGAGGDTEQNPGGGGKGACSGEEWQGGPTNANGGAAGQNGHAFVAKSGSNIDISQAATGTITGDTITGNPT